ncbi:hypothetical protein [Salinicola sp. CPA57]|uniref:hypothetical protein n=1 Tax=Salinicola sp. CPA57 TaxID=1949080 RepID=UPI000DA1CCC3|nr:hypothetical protein [Salinicola sp. CPA57]
MTPTQQAQSMVEYYIEAETAVLLGQSFSKNGRTLTMANLSEIRKGREYWERRLQQLSGRGGGVYSFARFVDE